MDFLLQVCPWDRFDPVDHPRMLPWIILLKREHGPSITGGARLRYAVCGTGITELFGFSNQGNLFGENLPPETVVHYRDEFERVMAGSGPIFSRTELPVPGRDFYDVYRGVFAFTSANGAGGFGNGNEAPAVDRICVILAPADLDICQ